MKESILYEKLSDKKVKCETCRHFCVIDPGKLGICGVRENFDGTLLFLAYGRLVAANIDPVEKKPLFHFMPATKTFSIGTVGCNFRCGNCQNWSISQFSKFPDTTRQKIKDSGEYLPPEKVVELAKENGCPSLSYTYTEPTIFLEYALDAMKLAKKAGIKNIWVSNGFMSQKTLALIMPYLDAINIDIKSFDEKFYRDNCGAKLPPILENLKTIVKNGIWLETTTLVIPTLSDDPKMLSQIARFIKEELGDFVPWHVSAFSGEISWKLQHLGEAPVEKIKQAYEIGKAVGLRYVYAGNIFGSDMESTYCPMCKKKMVSRTGYNVERLDKEGACAKCGENLNIKN